MPIFHMSNKTATVTAVQTCRHTVHHTITPTTKATETHVQQVAAVQTL